MEPVLLLHIIVILLAILFAYIGVKKNRKTSKSFRWNYGYLISLIILLCLMGFRESLGRDLPNYERIFTSQFQQNYVFGETREIGFLLLVRYLKWIGLEFQSFIFISSFIILFLFYISYRKFYYLLPFGILIFFADWGYVVTINTIRQGIALMAFLNATLFIECKEKNAGKKFLFFMIFGLLFHYSILFFLPSYFIGRLKLDAKYFSILCLALFVVSIFVILPIYETTLSLMEKYQNYVNNQDTVFEGSNFGLGATLVLLIRIAPLTIYSYVQKNRPELLKFFVLYFIGVSVYYGFFKYLIITRITFYLQFLELFVLAYFVYFLFVEKKKYRLWGVFYVFFMIFNYVYTFDYFLIDQLAAPNYSVMFLDFFHNVRD